MILILYCTLKTHNILAHNILAKPASFGCQKVRSS